MSTILPPSLTDSDSESPRSSLPSLSSSSLGSLKEENMSSEKMEQLVRKLRSENKALQLRVLGVNELARLLQDRNENVKVLQDRNKRLEVAVVRLENRCANLEQKLKSEGGTSGPKSMQAPLIPGPSRQILEGLMKESSDLKKALNNLQKKGASGYLEAVKTTQLEEVIEQQKQELDFLRGQINALTTTPLPPSSSSPPSQEEMARNQDALPGAKSADSPGTLQRQLIKMQHALKVKDKFCSLLSEQVSLLQDKLNEMTLDKTPEPEPPSEGRETTNTDYPTPELTEPDEYRPIVKEKPMSEHPQIKELKQQLIKQKDEMEGKYNHTMQMLKETVQKEREEQMSLVDKLQKSEQEMKRKSHEIDELEKRCDGLSLHVHTLLSDKKELVDTIRELKASSGGEGDASGLERELRELQNTLQQKIKEHSQELKEKDKEVEQLRMMLEDTQYKYVIAESKLSGIENEYKQKISDLKEKVDEKDSDCTVKQNEIENLKRSNRQLTIDMSDLRSKMSQPPVHFSQTRSYASPPISHVPLMLPNTMHNMETVRDSASGDAVMKRPTHSQLDNRCNTNQLDHMNRMELIARDMTPPTTSTPQPPPPSSLPFRPSNPQGQPPPPQQRHLPSPSPSSSSSANPHPQSISGRRSPVTPGPPHNIPGRRSPVTPVYGQQPLRPPPLHPQYPVHTPHSSGSSVPPTQGGGKYLSAVTPMSYNLPPRPQQPQRHPMHPSPMYMGGRQPMGPGGMSMPPRPPRGDESGEPGYHGDPSTSPQHHPHHPRR